MDAVITQVEENIVFNNRDFFKLMFSNPSNIKKNKAATIFTVAAFLYKWYRYLFGYIKLNAFVETTIRD